MWDNLHFNTLCLKTERFHSNAANYALNNKGAEIPTTTAGGLWGAYLMTVAHFCRELAS